MYVGGAIEALPIQINLLPLNLLGLSLLASKSVGKTFVIFYIIRISCNCLLEGWESGEIYYFCPGYGKKRPALLKPFSL